jgi:hypothetical protein
MSDDFDEDLVGDNDDDNDDGGDVQRAECDDGEHRLERVRRLEAWLDAVDAAHRGARGRRVAFAHSGELGVTAVAGDAFAAGEALVSVPLDAHISAHTVLRGAQSPFAALPALHETLTALLPAESASDSVVPASAVARADVVAVYLFLVWARFGVGLADEQRLFWAAYVDALPRRVGTPLQWSEAELALLHGTNARAAVRSLLIAVYRMCDALMPALAERYGADVFPERLYDYPRFVWAYELFWSRCMAVPQLDGTTLPALVPFVDLLNHDPAARVDYLTDPQTGRFGLVTRVPLAAGAPLFNNYGARSNEKLLLLYGFALANNEVDDVQLRLGVDDEELGRQKLALLRAHAAHSWGVAQRLPCDGSLLPSLRWTMRVLVATRLELYAWDGDRVSFLLAPRDAAPTPADVGAVSARNEAASLHALALLLEERWRVLRDGDLVAARQLAELLGVPAPAAADDDDVGAQQLFEAALSAPTTPPRYRSALHYRIGQRRIVAAAVAQAGALRAELASAFLLDERAMRARFVGGYASFGTTLAQPAFVELAPSVYTVPLARTASSAEGVDTERRRTQVAPDVAFLALGAPCSAGDVLARVPLAQSLSFPGVPPSAALLGVAEGSLPAAELDARWKALADALLAAGLDVDDVAALWLSAERCEAERDPVAAAGDAARWWRAWLLSMNVEGKSFAAIAWSSIEWQNLLHSNAAVDNATQLARSLERHCDQLFAAVVACGGAARGLFMTSQRYAWANDIIATRGVRDAAGRLCIVPLTTLPAPAPSGVGCVERVVDVAAGVLTLRALCALPAGTVLTEFGGDCGGSSLFTAEERLLSAGFAYVPDADHDHDSGLINHFPISVQFANDAAATDDNDDNDDDDDDDGVQRHVDVDDAGAAQIVELPDTHADLAAFEGPGSESSRHALLNQQRISPRLLATLRSAIGCVPVTEARHRLSLANEGAAIAALQQVVQSAGGRFPTRLAADQAAFALLTDSGGDGAAPLPAALVPQRDAWLAMVERFGESHTWRIAAALCFMISSKTAIAATWTRLGDVIRDLDAEAERGGARARTRE